MPKSISSIKSVLLILTNYSLDLHKGVVRYANEAGWRLDASASFTRKLPPTWNGHGIIADVSETDSPLSDYLNKCKKPIVSVRTDCPLKRVPKVIPDNIGAGREMAREFLNMGLNHFGFYTAGMNTEVVKQRYRGFESELKKAGKKVILLDFTKELSGSGSGGAEQTLAEALKKLPKPIGIGTQNDYDSIFACHAALHAGLKIPNEVAVVGIDNDPMTAEHGPMPLSSVNTNLDVVGYRAASLLHNLMRGRKAPATTISIPSGGVVRRRSTERYWATDPSVLKAIKFIDKNYTTNIDVAKIVANSGLPRRVFFAQFKKELGITPKQVLLSKRLGHAKQLLKNDDLTIYEVATSCGFNTNAAFIKFFKKATGCLPSDYRFKNE